MLYRGLGLLVLAAFATPAVAADIEYPAAPPPRGSSFYSPNSIAGDVSLAIGAATSQHGVEGFAGGRVSFPWGSGWNEELEAAGALDSHGNDALGVFSHTYLRTSTSALGLELGVSGGTGMTVFTTGAEAAVFLPRAKFTGQLAYSWGNGGGWSLMGEGAYYLTRETKIAGQLTWVDLGNNHVGASATLEHHWTGTPYDGFASLVVPGDGSLGVIAGVHFLLDGSGQTLQAHDQAVPFSSVLGFGQLF